MTAATGFASGGTERRRRREKSSGQESRQRLSYRAWIRNLARAAWSASRLEPPLVPADSERMSVPYARSGPLEALDRLARRPWFSYLALLLFQLKVVWGIWQYRDLAVGDESGYYNRAFLWFKDWSVDLVWSPLYTAFLGTLMHLSTDAYVVTTLHRLVIVLALDALILAVMRRLLPHWIAWLIAAWWAILPINFDTVSTVHLFVGIPVLAAWLLILHKPSSWTRGGAIAMLIVTSVLVRNEYLVATVLLALACLGWEIAEARGRVASPPRRSTLVGYGLPLVMAGGVVLFFYARSIYPLPELWAGGTLQHYRPPWSAHSGLGPKHTYNMCQVYAFGYQQRHPEWNPNPMLDCSGLMQSTFGTPLPSLLEMLRQSPLAVLEHFWWNIRLAPSGIQLLLFNASAGSVNPDYFPTRLHSRRALVLSLVTACILALGLCLLWRDRRFWWEHWLEERALGWLAILSVVAVAGLIIPTQRPRPSYLFCQGIALMAIAGMCVFAISRRWPMVQNLSRWLPVVMVLALLTVPGHYQPRNTGRPLLALYERLAPFAAAFHRSDSIFLVSGYVIETHDYVGHNYFTSPLVNFDYSVLDKAPPDRPLPAFLDRLGVNLFYVDENLGRTLWANPVHRPFLTSPESAGWRALASRTTASGTWMLLQKSS